jgi:hypothetical protein
MVEVKLEKKNVSGIMVTLLLLSMLMFAFSVSHVGALGPWVWVRDTVTGNYGEAVVGTGTDIYIARGNSFYRYRPSDNSFVELAAPPQPDGAAFKTGTALAWNDIEFDYIYALYGAATGESRRFFYRYSISSDSWERLPDTPVDQGEGDTITWAPIPLPIPMLYATIGGEQRPTYFMTFEPGIMQWNPFGLDPADPPGGMGDGASLVWIEPTEYLYALRGEFLETEPLYDFWRYSILENTWTAMADIPAWPHSGGSGGVGDGGSLLYISEWQFPGYGDYIYALSGNQAHPDGIPDNRFYRYTISTNTWERLADLPFGVGYYVGARLAYADGNIYAWQGTPSTWTGGGDDLAKRSPTEAHDIATTNVTPLKTVVGQGYTMNINVTVENHGDFTETFDVTLYANTTIIETKQITLTSLNSTTITFTWNTSGFVKGNYTISAYAWPVQGETDTEDNSLTDGWAIVSMVGDVVGDISTPGTTDWPNGKVDMMDVYAIALTYGHDYPDPWYNPNLDWDNDQKIGMSPEYYLTCMNYGKTDP